MFFEHCVPKVDGSLWLRRYQAYAYAWFLQIASNLKAYAGIDRYTIRSAYENSQKFA